MNKLWLLTALCSTSLILGCSQNNDAGIAEKKAAELQPTVNTTLDNIPESGEKVSDGPKFDLLTTPVGEIDFPNTCSTEAGVLVERGVALMHNMMYREAQFVFSMADDADADCAMAYWGQAMTQIHPLWQDNLNAEEYARGLELTKKAQSIADTTQREKQYFKAAEVFYAGGPSQTMKEGYVNMSRIWDETSTSMPNDMDAKAFNALFKIAIAKSEDDREVAGQLALDILQEMSNHPGGHHYVIHAFDTANLAGKALTTADHYGEITPAVTHASHMLTHTYTRLGKWSKAIKWNDISANSAIELCVANGAVNSHYPHAMDYLMYAHLQKGDDVSAARIQKEMFSLDIPEFERAGRSAISYAYSAIPVRYVLERKDWTSAITLAPRMPAHFPWADEHDREVSNTHFARALAFSRLGRADEANEDIEILSQMGKNMTGVKPLAKSQDKIEVQVLTVKAWQQYANGKTEAALSMMKQASDRDAVTTNSASGPGDMLPAEELYADMLLDQSRLAEAHDAYKLALVRTPGRYNSIYGAGKTAFEMGDTEVAQQYFNMLLKNTEGAVSSRPSLDEVRRLIAAI